MSVTTSRLVHTDKFTHPSWCDPRTCEVVGDNIDHADIVARWRASRSDTAVTVSMTQMDEVFQGEQLIYEPNVTVHFEFLAGCYKASYRGQEFDIAAYAKLSPEDCRQLGMTLLELANRVEEATPAGSNRDTDGGAR